MGEALRESDWLGRGMTWPQNLLGLLGKKEGEGERCFEVSKKARIARISPLASQIVFSSP